MDIMDNLENSYTFEVQLTPRHELLTSSGRWETIEEAAQAAAEYLLICAKNNLTNCMVRLKPVEELKILEV